MICPGTAHWEPESAELTKAPMEPMTLDHLLAMLRLQIEEAAANPDAIPAHPELQLSGVAGDDPLGRLLKAVGGRITLVITAAPEAALDMSFHGNEGQRADQFGMAAPTPEQLNAMYGSRPTILDKLGVQR